MHVNLSDGAGLVLILVLLFLAVAVLAGPLLLGYMCSINNEGYLYTAIISIFSAGFFFMYWSSCTKNCDIGFYSLVLLFPYIATIFMPKVNNDRRS